MGIELIRNLRITNITTQPGNVFTTPTLRYSLFFLKKDVDNSFNKNNKEKNVSSINMKINKDLLITIGIIMVKGKTDSRKR